MILNRYTQSGYFLVAFSLIIMLAAGCTQKKSISGKEFIPKDKLVLVMKDMYLIDGITNDVKYYRKYNPIDSIDLYSSIFEKHEVSREKYEHTIAEYSKYPDLLNEVYDEVLMQLNLLLEEEELSRPQRGDARQQYREDAIPAD